MKINMKKHTFLVAIVLIVAGFMSCQKGDSDTAFGYTNIYMPEATVTGGLNLNYLVPSGAGLPTYNFQIDSVNHKLNVILGVTRSGKASADGYTVDVVVYADTTNQQITNKAIINGVLLPTTMYTLPTKVTVPTGKNYASFYLSIDATAFKAAAYTGKNVALTVGIANPSKYALYNKYSKTVIIINNDAILPKLK
jgi:hypothetical protein